MKLKHALCGLITGLLLLAAGNVKTHAQLITPQPITQYNFEGNGNDSIGTRNLALSGTVAFSNDTPSGSGQAIVFDGSTTRAFYDVTGTDSLSGNFTVMAYVKTTSHGGFLITTRRPDEWCFGIQVLSPDPNNSKSIEGTLGTGSGPTWLTTAAGADPVLNLDTWYHIAYVVSPNAYTIYLDGIEIGSGAYNGAALLFNATHDILIGTDVNSTNVYTGPNYQTIGGLIDDVRIYGTALTGAQVQAAMSNDPPEPVLQLKAADYNPATGIWTDSSGQNNHATQTIANATWWPSLEPNVTANGSSVVRCDSDDRLALLREIAPTSDADGFTMFAYTRPTADGGVGRVLIAGGRSSPNYGVAANNGRPYIGRTSLQTIGFADTVLSTTDFSNINVKVNDAGASFRLNGSPDGSVNPGANAPFNKINRICAEFLGDVAEIRIYNSQLTAVEIAGVEAELQAAYELPLNSAPTANAGADQSIRSGDTVDLDGSASFDDITSPALLDYQWSFDSVPVGSLAILTDADTVFASFDADVPGTYSLKLIVTDEGALSSEDDVEINTIDSFTVDVQTGIESLLLDPLLTDKAGDKLNDAIDKLVDAQEEMAQGGDVKKGLKKISDAVKKLLDAQDEGADVTFLIVQLVESAFAIAQDAIEAAIAAGGDMDDIVKAMEEMVKAQEDLDDGKPEKAIDHYAKAWDKVQP